MARHNQVGSWGEQIAVEHLIKCGYAIVETNWRLNHLEIDIVARIDTRVVFVEVKTRSNYEDDPLQAVDRRKMSRMTRAANYYIVSKDIPLEPQFDIITIVGTQSNYTLEHIADAFLPPLRTYR